MTEIFLEGPHPFHKTELIRRLNAVLERTLGEVDVNHVFDKTKEHPKITGIFRPSPSISEI